MTPDIMAFFQFGHTQRRRDTHTRAHTQAQKIYWSMWKFTEQNSENKKTETDLGLINMEGR